MGGGIALDPTPADGEPKGWLSFQGRFMEGSKGGPWQVGGRGGPGMGTGDFGGPFVVFHHVAQRIALGLIAQGRIQRGGANGRGAQLGNLCRRKIHLFSQFFISGLSTKVFL